MSDPTLDTLLATHKQLIETEHQLSEQTRKLEAMTQDRDRLQQELRTILRTNSSGYVYMGDTLVLRLARPSRGTPDAERMLMQIALEEIRKELAR